MLFESYNIVSNIKRYYILKKWKEDIYYGVFFIWDITTLWFDVSGKIVSNDGLVPTL